MTVEMTTFQRDVLDYVFKKKPNSLYGPTNPEKIEAAEYWFNKGIFEKKGKKYYLNESKRGEVQTLLEATKAKVKKRTVSAGLLPTTYRSAHPKLEKYLEDILSRLKVIESRIMKGTAVAEKRESLKLKISEHQLPLILKQAYDQVKLEEPRFSDLIPLSYIKPKLFGKYDVSNEEINKILLELEKKREIDLQVAYDAREVKNPEFGINLPGRGLVFFVRWRS